MVLITDYVIIYVLERKWSILDIQLDVNAVFGTNIITINAWSKDTFITHRLVSGGVISIYDDQIQTHEVLKLGSKVEYLNNTIY